MSRASTVLGAAKKDVDGRVKPGHDVDYCVGGFGPTNKCHADAVP
jgi:hypothetical protein